MPYEIKPDKTTLKCRYCLSEYRPGEWHTENVCLGDLVLQLKSTLKDLSVKLDSLESEVNHLRFLIQDQNMRF